MRRKGRIAAPLFVISLYYFACLGGFHLLRLLFPELEPHLPVGGLEELITRGSDSFEFEVLNSQMADPPQGTRLLLAIFAATALMVPISWVYFITTQDGRIDRSFAQTMIVLPTIVAGIAAIVQHSLALAFSLAGVVAAVRFRFTLKEPAHTLYIFAAITIGLGAGVSAIGVATTVSIAFVYLTLMLWYLEYGNRLNAPFFSFLTRRDRLDQDD